MLLIIQNTCIKWTNTREVTVKILEKFTVKIGEEKFLSNLRITVVFEEGILSSENKIQEERVKLVEPRCKAY